MKQLLILSGKGGTGKTTVAGAFIALSAARAYADCDVDAPNLHLIMRDLPEPARREYFGMDKAYIDPERCTDCGICAANCRFNAILTDDRYVVDTYVCEGCGVCEALCPTGAVEMRPAVAGELLLYRSGTVFSTAKLKMGSGNSGMLVTEVKKQLKSEADSAETTIIDGSPGIGCPVIASLSGAEMVLIVAEPSVSGISDMERIIKTAAVFGMRIAVCVNKYDVNVEKTNEIEAFCIDREIPFTGRIPYDPEAVIAVNLGKNIVETGCPAGSAAKEVFIRTMEIFDQKKAGEK